MSRAYLLLSGLLVGAFALAGGRASVPEGGPRRIVLVAGRGSHGFGCHAHRAGCMLLARLLNENVPGVRAVACHGWPKEPSVLEQADAILICCDGGSLILGHPAELGKLMRKGIGLGVIHYGLCVPKERAGQQMLDWIGGYYETHWSVNPTWHAHFKSLPKHPVTRGVRPFRIRDEWYYHMRFRDKMEGVTPVLTAVPPDSTRKRPFGAHSGNPEVRKRMGLPEHVAWVYQRPDGGRGFGFTGAHWHWNWAHDDYRKLVLNALVWIARADVPPNGVPPKTPTVEELEANQESQRPPNVPASAIQDFIDEFKRPPRQK